jgi:hypothetical protein
MRVDIDFANVETGATKTVTVMLTAEEVATIRAGRYEDYDVIFMAKGLKHAYRDIGPGFRHIAAPEGIRLTPVH